MLVHLSYSIFRGCLSLAKMDHSNGFSNCPVYATRTLASGNCIDSEVLQRAAAPLPVRTIVEKDDLPEFDSIKLKYAGSRRPVT
jgi:hypothetical protein